MKGKGKAMAEINRAFDDDDFDLNWDFEDESEKSESTLEEGADQEDVVEQEEADADGDGTVVDLMEETTPADKESDYYVTAQDDFLDDNGNIVVMDNDNPDEGSRFELAWVDIDRISIATDRIRKSCNFENIHKSVRSTGLLEPIAVAPTRTEGYYVLLHGYKRLYACAKCGMTRVPCVVNNRIKTAEIPILEALYNQHSSYSMKEIVDYIDYLEKDKGIMNASLIEYLMQLNNGDYNKLKDVLEDEDPDIAGKLLEDQMSIAQAFKALETKRKKQSKEEKELAKTSKAYNNDSGMEIVAGSGEVGSEPDGLSDEQVNEMIIDPKNIDKDISEQSLDEMVENGKTMEGFEPHVQNYKEREIIDPAIRKAVMSRDNNTCQCCKRGGPDYVDILDLHHIKEVFLGGADTVENSIALCTNCHKQVHLYAYGKLHIPKSKTEDELNLAAEQAILAEDAVRKEKGKPEMTEDEKNEFKEHFKVIYAEEQNKYKRIVYLGNKIRSDMQARGMTLDKAKKEHPIDKIGRQKPGEKNQIA